MLKVNKNDEPKFLLDYKRKYSPRNWNDFNKDDIKNKIKENILNHEQNEYCPYCEQRIYDYDKSHIEHIKPKDLFPNNFQDYNNLLVSCNEINSCGMFKQNNYSDEFINPVLENPSEYLTYNIASGEIIPNTKDEESEIYSKAKYTIDVLNLNSYELTNARRNLIDMMEVYTGENKQYLQYFIDDKHMFPSLIKLYMEI